MGQPVTLRPSNSRKRSSSSSWARPLHSKRRSLSNCSNCWTSICSQHWPWPMPLPTRNQVNRSASPSFKNQPFTERKQPMDQELVKEAIREIVEQHHQRQHFASTSDLVNGLRERGIDLPQSSNEAWEQVADVRAQMRLF